MNGNGAICFYTDLQDVYGPAELPVSVETYTWELQTRGDHPGANYRVCRYHQWITNPDLWFKHWKNKLLGADGEPED